MSHFSFIRSSNIPNVSSIIFKNETNKRYLLWGGLACLLQFVVFKIGYPYADFFSDSYSYIFGAAGSLEVNIWPIGYSKFLALIHAVSYSDTIVVAFQYFLIQAASFYLFFTIKGCYQTNLLSSNIFFAFIVANPLTLYLSNTINSDALFAGLSIWWITELIWIIERPTLVRILVQGSILFLCFTIRNNAYYYPIILATALLLIKIPVWKKVTGLAFPFLLIFGFIIYTQQASVTLTGTKQFSLFTGWQLANNALYIYDKATVDSSGMPTIETKRLDRIARQFYGKYDDRASFREVLNDYVGNYFIREPKAPLKKYFYTYYRPHSDLEVIRDWAKASEVFETFGKKVILRNPIAYVRYFVYPNVFHYLLPPLSHIETYAYGKNKVDPIAQRWFHYSSPTITCVSNTLQGEILRIYPVLFLLLHFYLITSLFKTRRIGITNLFRSNKSLLLIFLPFLFLNFCFSIAVTENILRYQFVSLFLLIPLCIVIRPLEMSTLNDQYSAQLNKTFHAKVE